MLEKWHCDIILRLKFKWDFLIILVKSKWILIFHCEKINLIYLYVQNDVWVNEKLILKLYPLN